jgi:hypothetical protein
VQEYDEGLNVHAAGTNGAEGLAGDPDDESLGLDDVDGEGVMQREVDTLLR